MSQEILRDSRNNVVGYIRKVGSRECVFNKNNKLIGWYDETTDMTRDGDNKYIGKGNQIKRLL